MLDGAHDMVTKIRALIAAVAAGELSPEEANQVASLLDLERKVVEVSSFEERHSVAGNGAARAAGLGGRALAARPRRGPGEPG